MMRFEHNRSCSLSSERASTFASESSVRSRSLERNSSHFVRSALYPYPPVSETYHRDHRRGKNGEKSRKNMKWRSYSSVNRRTNSASPCRSHDRHHSGRSRSSSRDRSDRHGKRRNRSRSRSESAHRSHDHHRRPTSSSSRHFDRNPHFSDLPLEWWEREEDCKLAKEAHTDKIDYLWPSREDLVLETTLAEDDTVLEPNMFPYATPEGIAHYTLWSKRDLSHHEIVHFVDGWLSKHHPQVRRWQYDDNSGERSILLFHVHVFIEMVPFCFRPRPGMEYFPPHIA